MTSLVALTGNNTLVSFKSDEPNNTTSVSVTGLDGTLLGVDTRPANGMLYGITGSDTIYTINVDTGIATQVSTLDTPFNAAAISGFDFNPVADRLRLVGNNEQDFRINVDTGEVTVDGDLAFAANDPNAGDNPSVTAAAYTNSFAGTTETMLYDIDAAQDILVLQNPPNDGVLQTIGELGVDFSLTGGFEIASTPAGSNEAFAVSDGTLYSIDLASGAATSLGMVGSDDDDDSDRTFRGISVRPEPQVNPIADDSQFLALTEDDRLISFDPNSPDMTTTIEISGLDAPLLGIDTRPSNGRVYGITTANTVYTINPISGRANRVSTLNESFNAESVSGFDFNPVADRLRLVGDNDQDFRINVETGEVTIDGTLRFAEGDVNEGANPRVTAAAYTNAIANPSTTALYDIDTDLDVLVLQNPPNDGILMTRGPLGFDIDEIAGFDIISSGEENVGELIAAGQALEKNAAFAVANGALYDIDIVTGAAMLLGAIGDGSENFKGLATVEQLPPVVIEGTNGRDRIFGTNGNDIINALAGDDVVIAENGNDVINGGSGSDRIFGNKGNDTINGNSEQDALFGGRGDDFIDGGGARDRLFGNLGDDVVMGGAGDDTLFGGRGDDILLGGSGGDRVFGGSGRDILIGGSGNDFFNGSTGDDVIVGGIGQDRLRGGEGADVFVIGTNKGTDTVLDFRVGIDTIGLIDGELSFADLTITQAGNRTLLGVSGSRETLAILQAVDASSLGASNFDTVSNIATAEDAMMLM